MQRSACRTSIVLVAVLLLASLYPLTAAAAPPLPLPPLDGYSVFSYFFPKVLDFNSEFKRGAVFFLFLLILFSFDKIFK